jgi:putative membrane protein
VGLKPVDDEHHQTATWTNHFAFGATAGTLYPLVNRLPLPPLVKSILFGVGIWLVSYLGWLPVTGLLASATKQSKSRNLMMIAAHVVWGAVTGMVFRRWPRTEKIPADQSQPAPAYTV